MDVNCYISNVEILNNVGCGICVCSSEEKVLFANEKFGAFFHGKIDGKAVKTTLSGALKGKEADGSGELYIQDDDKWFHVQRKHIRWMDQRMVELYTVYDITKTKQDQQRIERQANNDFLTGLYNRMRCEKDLEEQVDAARRENKEGALLYMDLDDFKHINDGLGHQYGDVLLKGISNSLKRISGIESSCYRMGGDEFIVIVSDSGGSSLNRILDDICKVFEKPWFLKGADYYCTMSMGIVRFPTDGDTVQELIKKADLALLEAKRAGKNRCEFYTAEEEGKSFKRLDLEKICGTPFSMPAMNLRCFISPLWMCQKKTAPVWAQRR